VSPSRLALAAGELGSTTRVSVARRCGAGGSAAVGARWRRYLTDGSPPPGVGTPRRPPTDDPSTRHAGRLQVNHGDEKEGRGPVSVLRRPRPEAKVTPCSVDNYVAKSNLSSREGREVEVQ